MRVLIATDGSEFSKAAVKECCRMILRPGSEVLIVSAFEDAYPITPEPVVVNAEYYQLVEDSLKKMADDDVESARKLIEEAFDGKVAVSTEILRGFPDQEIIEKAKEWKAELIVVGSHGRGFWGRLLGSVSNGVVHHASCSVLVVRNGAEKEEN